MLWIRPLVTYPLDYSTCNTYGLFGEVERTTSEEEEEETLVVVLVEEEGVSVVMEELEMWEEEEEDRVANVTVNQEANPWTVPVKRCKNIK